MGQQRDYQRENAADSAFHTWINRRQDSRAAIVALLRDSPAMLTTPQIMARIGLTKVPTLIHLAALEESGRIGKVAGKPYRWFWRADTAEDGAADAAD